MLEEETEMSDETMPKDELQQLQVL